MSSDRPLPWLTPATHEYARHESGECFALDIITGDTWQLEEPCYVLLHALREGWQPGDPVPPALAVHLAPEEHGDELADALAELERDGLVERIPKPPIDPAALLSPLRTRGWTDVRLRLMSVPPPPLGARSAVLLAARATPLLALVALVGSWAVWFGEASSRGMAEWIHHLQTASPGQIVLVQVLAILFLTVSHELGHAFVAACATGRAIPIGLRFNHGLPQGYAEIFRIITVPQRADRVSIILGGLAVEILVWVLFLPLVLSGGGGPFALAVVVLGGGLSALINLIPFWKNDGYLLLQEATGLRDLMDRSIRSAAREFLGGAGAAGDPPWLSWMGLFHVHAMAAIAAILGTLLGRLVGHDALGATVGLAIALFLLRRNYANMRASRTSPPEPG